MYSVRTVLNKHLLTALLTVVLCGCDLFVTPVNAGEKNMTELTKTMRPVCFGRLVIEIPAVAKTDRWNQKVGYTNIESVAYPSPNRKSFDAKNAQREKQLITSPHKTDGVLLKDRSQLSPDSVLFVYREDKNDTYLYQLDALLPKDEARAKYWYEIAAQRGVSEARNYLEAVSRENTIPRYAESQLRRQLVEENMQHVQQLPEGVIKFNPCIVDVPGPEGMALPYVKWRIVVLKKPSDEPFILKGLATVTCS
jgi:hypothetical protein